MDKVAYFNAASFSIYIPEPGSGCDNNIGRIKDIAGNPFRDDIPKRENGAVAYYSLAAGRRKEGYSLCTDLLDDGTCAGMHEAFASDKDRLRFILQNVASDIEEPIEPRM